MFKLVSKFYEVVPGVLTQTGKVCACLANADAAMKSAALSNAAFAKSDVHELHGEGHSCLRQSAAQLAPRLASSAEAACLC